MLSLFTFHIYITMDWIKKFHAFFLDLLNYYTSIIKYTQVKVLILRTLIIVNYSFKKNVAWHFLWYIKKESFINFYQRKIYHFIRYMKSDGRSQVFWPMLKMIKREIIFPWSELEINTKNVAIEIFNPKDNFGLKK